MDTGIETRHESALMPFEQSVLTISGCFFWAYEEPESQCWMRAFIAAERRFPPPLGATTAQAIHVSISDFERVHGGRFSLFQVSEELVDYAVMPAEKQLIEALRAVATEDADKSQ